MKKFPDFKNLKKIEASLALSYYASHMLEILFGTTVRMRLLLVFWLTTYPLQTISTLVFLVLLVVLIKKYSRIKGRRVRTNVRKLKIYKDIADGLPSRIISKKYNISVNTINKHRKELFTIVTML